MIGSGTAVLWCAALFACASATGYAQQQAAKDYPSRPIRLLVPWVPGGSNDVIGHLLEQKIAPSIGQNMFMDNRGGAGGAIGTDIVAKSPPDGYTILLTSSSHTILPSISKRLPYDPVKDFTPITLLARSVGSLLTVHPSVPARSVRQLIALAKAQPGRLNYASAGSGSATHFSAELFRSMAGIDMMHVPYKGTGQAIVDLLTGRVEVALFLATAMVEHVRSGKLRALAITAPSRWSELADVSTMDEAGVKGYNYALWYGLWFPAGTPPEYVARIRAEVVKAFADPVAKRTFAEQGLVAVVSTPQEFGRKVVEEIELHRQLVAKMGLAPQQ